MRLHRARICLLALYIVLAIDTAAGAVVIATSKGAAPTPKSATISPPPISASAPNWPPALSITPPQAQATSTTASARCT